MAAAFAAPLSPATGATVIELTPLAPHTLFTPENTDLGDSLGNVVYQGLGRLVKTGAGAAVWGARSATFALQAGSWIDVLEGRFIGGSGVNEDWSRNQASLHVAQGALFEGQEANVRVDALTGSGTIRTGFFDGHSRYGYQTFTLGVANGSGSFAGVLADGNSAGHFTKVGTGTQVLTGSNTYTGGTRVAGGTLAIGDGGRSGSILGPVQVDAGATLAFNRGDALHWSGTINGEGQLVKQGAGSLTLNQAVNLKQGIWNQQGLLKLQGAGLTSKSEVRNDGWLEVTGEPSAPLMLATDIHGNGRLSFTRGSSIASGLRMSAGLTEIGTPSPANVWLKDGTTLSTARLHFVYGTLTLSGPTTRVTARTTELTPLYGHLDQDRFHRDLDLMGGATLETQTFIQLAWEGSGTRLTGTGTRLTVTSDMKALAQRFEIRHGAELHAQSITEIGAQFVLDKGLLSIAAPRHRYYNAGGTYPFSWISGKVALQGDVPLDSYWLGGHTRLDQGRELAVGGHLLLGQGKLTVAQGGVLITGGLQGAGELFLDGGELRITALPSDPETSLRWQRGTLAITGDAGAALGQGGLKRMTVLDEGQTLQVSRTLSMARGTQLLLNGGQLRAGTVALQGGTLMTTGAPITLSEVGTLQGHGLVSGAVQGGARTQLVAQGGTLTLGDADLAGGFVHVGELRVERGATALLLSADAAQLGRLTELQAGARLATLNGATLTHGGVMSFHGDATVQGEFTHQGRIEGSGGTLSFLNDVQGAGSFAGSVLFKAGYQPGNSPARIDFGGGRLSFGTNAVLTLEFFGPQPGTGYDQLMNIGWLDFQGTLNLQFDSSFKPVAGSRFQLFDFQQFSGSLSADRITVSGLDRQQLDLSQLGSTGQLQVSAVPEPGSWALMGLGLAVLAWRQRRRQPAQAQAARSNS